MNDEPQVETATPEPTVSRAPVEGDVDRSDSVSLFGRRFPRANGAERFAWCVLLAGVVLVLAIATRLTPDPRGIGTHEQIPILGGHMNPCGFAYVTRIPCPSCGFTTTFALAAHGRFVEAVKNQPFGFLVFVVACALVPAGLVAAIGKVSWARATDEWPWMKIVLVTIALWLLAWTYKIEVTTIA